MTDANDPNFDSPEDRTLRDRIKESAPEPSAEHDSAVLAAAKAFAEETEEEEQASRSVPRWPMAAAAVLALGVATALILPALESTDPIVRGDSVGVVPSPGAKLTEAPDQFSLAERFAGLSCQITLRNGDGSTLWQSDAFESSVAVPVEVQDELGDGRYQWIGRCVGRGDVRFGPYAFTLAR